jgi:GLPGLI family protein
MNLKRTIYVIAIVCLPTSVWAQQKFIAQGKIEYERKTNQYAFMDQNSIWDNMAKNNMSKFVTYYYDLFFNDKQTLFKQGRDPETKQAKNWGVFDSENIILTKLDSNTTVTQRTIFGDVLLISDSVKTIDWKVTTEIRKIAGFDCRKAVGKMMDSVIVIAFYTDEIVTTGGPESFSGLPGMILGLAIPRLHTTWYATKLQLIDVTDKDMLAPKRGKKLTGPAYREKVKDLMKDWGEDATKRQMDIQLLL